MNVYTIILVLLAGDFVFSEIYEKTYYKSEDHENLFNSFMMKYRKSYKSIEEKQMRFEAFKKNVEKINELNSNSEHAVYGINMFADYTAEERRSSYKKSDTPTLCKSVAYDEKSFVEADEDRFDWRDHNVVTRVKSEGSFCYSAWIFAAIGAIEGVHAMKHKKLLSFSERQILECNPNYNIVCACKGGDPAQVISYVIETGIMLEKDYTPYNTVHVISECTFDKSKVRGRISGCNTYDLVNKEDKLKNLLKTMGPLAVGVNMVNNVDMWFYRKGIITTPCKNESVDSSALLVGWGSENGIPYWTFKNARGVLDGEEGYFRTKRGINALCIVSEKDTIVSAVV